MEISSSMNSSSQVLTVLKITFVLQSHSFSNEKKEIKSNRNIEKCIDVFALPIPKTINTFTVLNRAGNPLVVLIQASFSLWCLEYDRFLLFCRRPLLFKIQNLIFQLILKSSKNTFSLVQRCKLSSPNVNRSAFYCLK